MSRSIFRITDEDEFDDASRRKRSTILHEEIAKVLQRAAFPDRPGPTCLMDVAPLYLSQAFAIVEHKALRDDLVKLLVCDV